MLISAATGGLEFGNDIINQQSDHGFPFVSQDIYSLSSNVLTLQALLQF